MDEIIDINHQSVAVLPYYVDETGDVYIFGEIKDENFYSEPYRNAFTFIGGNFKCGGSFKDDSPETTYFRILFDETGAKEENIKNESVGKDTYSTILNDSSIEIDTGYKLKPIKDMEEIGQILIDNPQYVADYLVHVDDNEVVYNPIDYLSRIYTKQLSKEEFVKFQNIINDNDGALTSDNKKYGSKTVCYKISDMNKFEIPFSWGYDLTLNMLIASGHIPSGENINDITLIGSVSVEDVTSKLSDCLTYKEFENAGYRYKNNNN
ncbi:hypothetical protein GQ473_01695 [archaeon]|nr:hypothetical protein [archaeon]